MATPPETSNNHRERLWGRPPAVILVPLLVLLQERSYDERFW